MARWFYERHLAHISRRRDIWYVPMGPLYAYRAIHERTEVRPLPVRLRASNCPTASTQKL